MKELVLYTDGSHIGKNTSRGSEGNRLGIGAVLVDLEASEFLGGGFGSGKIMGKFGEEITDEDLYNLVGHTRVSNPTMELLAVLWALRAFKKMTVKDYFITVKADYIGVREWMTGKWKPKEPAIVKIKRMIEDEMGKQRLDGRIRFEWIKAHQSILSVDAYWNDYVDKLAKGERS